MQGIEDLARTEARRAGVEYQAPELLPYLIDASLMTTAYVEQPLCSGFPQKHPAAALGLALDLPRQTIFVTGPLLSELKLAADQAQQQALDNLTKLTPDLSSAWLQDYEPNVTSPYTMPRCICRLTGSNVLIVSFKVQRNSIRLLVPDVIDAMAAATDIPVSHMLVVATYERACDCASPMFAAACNDPSAVRLVHTFVLAERRKRPRTHYERTGEAVSASPFIMEQLSATNSGLATSTGQKYKARVYPGFGQQHALRLQALSDGSGPGSKGVVYVPWPIIADQRAALDRHMPLTVQDMRMCSPLQYPLPGCSACYCCTVSTSISAPKCGRCKVARYCNAECQRKDWPKHKHVCRV